MSCIPIMETQTGIPSIPVNIKENLSVPEFSGSLKRHKYSLRKKCPYSELFSSAFSVIPTECGEIGVSLCIQSEGGEIRTRITPKRDTFHAIMKVSVTWNEDLNCKLV